MSRNGPAGGRTETMARERPDQERHAVSDVTAEENENDRNEPDRPERSEPRPLGYARPPGRRGGLKLYKPGQGYYTRMWTAVGAAVIILWGGAAVYEQLSSSLALDTSYYYPVSYGVSAAFIVGLGAFVYWLVGLSRGANDFFIATEGEMKKVSWSSRKEVVRSTKVVITTVLLLGAMLFVVDVAFMWFFHLLDVLKAFPGIGGMIGMKS